MVKLDEIARIMGVSKAAVSLALNYKPGVGKEKAAQIRDVAATLGYVLPRTRSQGQQDEKVISCVSIVRRTDILNTYDSSFVSGFIDGISQGLSQSGYRLEITVYRDVSIEQVITSLQKKASAGFLVLATELEEQEIAKLSSFTAPMVLLDAYNAHIPLDSVSMNNAGAMYKVIQFLTSLGHWKIGYIHADHGNGNFSARRMSFFRAVKAFGCSYEHTEDHFLVEPTIKGSYHQMMSYLTAGRTVPKALVCGNDVIAIGSIMALQEFGYAVPDDVSVIGFDNLPGSEICAPPLTSMCISPRHMGYRAALRLLQRLSGDNSSFEKILIDGHVIQRDSVRPAE